MELTDTTLLDTQIFTNLFENSHEFWTRLNSSIYLLKSKIVFIYLFIENDDKRKYLNKGENFISI